MASEQTVAVYGVGGPITVTVGDKTPPWTNEYSLTDFEVSIFSATFTLSGASEFSVATRHCSYDVVETPAEAGWTTLPALVVRPQSVAIPKFTGDVRNGWFVEYSWDGRNWHLAVPGGDGYLGFDEVPAGTKHLLIRPSNGGSGPKSPSVTVDLTDWWAAIERERAEQALIESL